MNLLEELILKLKSNDWTVRRQAVIKLGETGFLQAVKPLLEALKDENPSIRKQAATSLANFQDSRTFDPLLETSRTDEIPEVRASALASLSRTGDIRIPAILADALSDPDIAVRKEACKAFRRTGNVFIDSLIKTLSHDSPIARLNAVRLLGESRDPRPLEPLISTLSDEDINVRNEAIIALGNFDDPSAFPPILSIFREGPEDCRWIAAEVLGKMGDDRAVEYLLEALKKESPRTCRAAVEAMGTLKGVTAIPELCRILVTGNGELDSAIINTLIKMGDQAVEHLLSNMGSSRETIRQQLSDILDKMGEPLGKAITEFFEGKQGSAEKLFAMKDPRTSIPLMTGLKNQDPAIRKKVVEFLGLSKSHSIIPLISSTLEDSDPEVRLFSAVAISAVGSRKDLKLLIPLIADPDVSVRREVIPMVSRIGIKVVDNLFDAYNAEKNQEIKSLILKELEDLTVKTHFMKENHRSLFCPVCLRRFTEFKLRINLFKNLYYYGCRECKGKKCVEGVREITVTLDHHAGHFMALEDDILFVNWFRKKKALDFDSVKIVDATGKDIKEFLTVFLEDDINLKGNGKQPVKIDKECKLGDKILALINSHFKVVI